MIHIKDIHLSFGEQVIFNNESCTLEAGQRIGIVGRNGSGKSTLLSCIAGTQQLDAGTITIAGSKTIAYMPQEVVIASKKTVFDEALSTFSRIYNLLQRASILERMLDQADQAPDALEEYAHVSQELAQENPAAAQTKTQEILSGLGFTATHQQQSVQELSSGWKMRLVLAKLLLQDADFYLFDEPTNHLDIIAKDWFLRFLDNAPFGFALVCHDRFFLDHACNQIVELELGTLSMYPGNFSTYEKKKDVYRQQRESAYEQQQKEIKRRTDLINRFRAKSSKAKMAQSMLKSLDKLERITLPPTPKSISIKLDEPQRSGRIVLTVDKIRHAFENKELFHSISFTIERNEKVALVAPNGIGKTTLFNIITGAIATQIGHITTGYNVTTALFAQDQAKALDGTATILHNCLQAAPGTSEQKVRALLGAFLFDQEALEKKVNVLSGGEKNRVGMACVLLQHANFLLLDEPTNNLDIPSKELLANALRQFKGTLFFVSHDHDFIDRLATRIVELTPNGIISFHGNYTSYRYQKKMQPLNSAIQPAQDTNSQEPNTKNKKESHATTNTTFAHKKEINKIERTIAKLEKEITQLEKRFVDLTYGTDQFIATEKKLTETKKTLEKTIAQWEKLHEEA